MDSPLDAYGGRRFLLIAASMVIYTALVILGYISSAEYVSLQVMSLGTYILGNGVQKYTDKRYGSVATPPAG